MSNFFCSNCTWKLGSKIFHSSGYFHTFLIKNLYPIWFDHTRHTHTKTSKSAVILKGYLREFVNNIWGWRRILSKNVLGLIQERYWVLGRIDNMVFFLLTEPTLSSWNFCTFAFVFVRTTPLLPRDFSTTAAATKQRLPFHLAADRLKASF